MSRRLSREVSLKPEGDVGNPTEVERETSPDEVFRGQSKVSLLTSQSTASFAENGSRRGLQRASTVKRSAFVLEHSRFSATLNDVYEVKEEILGKGGFGSIRLARLKGEGGPWDRVVKTVKRRSAKDKATFKREVDVLKTLDHPHVCRIFETFEEDKSFHLILEFIEGKDLYEFVFERFSAGKDFEEKMSGLVTWQMMQGLNYCHSSNIIHRDIKPENIMVAKAPERTGITIKIIDFGLAVDMETLSKLPRGSFSGTYAYVAPEVTSGKAHTSAASDFWAVGLITHVLLLGDLPSEEVRLAEEEFELHGARISKGARKFLVGLLQSDPEKRLAAARSELTNERSWINSHSVEYVFYSSVQSSVSTMNSEITPDQLRRANSSLAMKTMTAFVSFHRSKMLHQAVITAVAMQVMSSEHTDEIKKQFIAMDSDGNGKISQLEFRRAIAELSPEGIAADVDAWMARVFESVDTDGSGEIDFSEFLAAGIAECGARSEASIIAAFRVFDLDTSGKISMPEFARVFDTLPQNIADCMADFDTDGDGEISFEEFKGIVHGGNVVDRITGSIRISQIMSKVSSEGQDGRVTSDVIRNSQTNRRQVML